MAVFACWAIFLSFILAIAMGKWKVVIIFLKFFGLLAIIAASAGLILFLSSIIF